MRALAAELTLIDLGDRRLNRRARRMLEKLGEKPTVSIPAACGGWDETKAAYRLFDHPEVTFDAVLAPHAACTLERLRAHPRVLCIQDTTELDYTTKKDIAGLGPLSYESRRGMYLHPTLALTPERVPLGLLDVYSWAREPGSLGQEKDSNRPLEEKESVRWVDGFARVNELAEQLEDTRLTYIADREGDIYDLFVEAPEQAIEKLSWYLCRWQIEVYFKVLKSGCRVEQLQLEKRERLEPALAFYMIIAWRVLFLTMLGRDCPEMPCNTVFANEEWKAVYLVTQRKSPPEQPPSLDTMVRMVATLGGFLNRKSDGFPGPKTLWIGLQRVPDFVLALEAQRSIGESCG
jgi:hypothetical protein